MRADRARLYMACEINPNDQRGVLQHPKHHTIPHTNNFIRSYSTVCHNFAYAARYYDHKPLQYSLIARHKLTTRNLIWSGTSLEWGQWNQWIIERSSRQQQWDSLFLITNQVQKACGRVDNVIIHYDLMATIQQKQNINSPQTEWHCTISKVVPLLPWTTVVLRNTKPCINK